MVSDGRKRCRGRPRRRRGEALLLERRFLVRGRAREIGVSMMVVLGTLGVAIVMGRCHCGQKEGGRWLFW